MRVCFQVPHLLEHAFRSSRFKIDGGHYREGVAGDEAMLEHLANPAAQTNIHPYPHEALKLVADELILVQYERFHMA